MDMSGGVFCTLSLIFKKEFDIVAGVSGLLPAFRQPLSRVARPDPSLAPSCISSQCNYIGIVLLDGLILILACILNPRANRRRKREARASGDDDSSPASVEEGERGRDVGAISGVDRVEGEGLVQVASRLEEERRSSTAKDDEENATVRSASR